MPTVELIPVDQGNRLVLDENSITTIGRTPNIGCLDKKISRNHAELHIKPEGTVWIKPIHHNPTFFKTKTNQLVTLTKDKEFELHDGDEFGLLPSEYFYRLSIQSADKTNSNADNDRTIETSNNETEIENTSTRPKSPIENHDHEETVSPKRSSIKQSDEDEELSAHLSDNEKTTEVEGGVILHTRRALPTWMSNNTATTAKPAKGRGKQKTSTATTDHSPVKNQTYVGRKKAEGIIYEDDNDDSNENSTTTKDQSTTDESQKPSGAGHPKKRERCPYGKFCYRKNPLHRLEAIHPGDPEWDNKENDEDNATATTQKKPECPYGTDCYRKNPDHLKEYSHTRQPSSTANKRRSSKRKNNDEEDDDDDGLPNTYDYDDSFIDDDELLDSVHNDRTGTRDSDADQEWKPHKKVKHSDDNEDESSDDSEIDLMKKEAAEFIQSSSASNRPSVKKKARVSDEDDDDS